MISIKNYLSRSEDSEAYRQMISLLLDGIATHAIEGEKADHEKFREDIRGIERQVAQETSAPVLFASVGATVRALEDYTRRATLFIKKQNAELHHMVAMLTRTVITIGDSSNQSVSTLQDIERRIEKAREIEDIQILKLKLGECLEAVHQEAVRQKVESEETLQTLRRQIERSRAYARAPEMSPEIDSVTGLPNSAAAEKAIRQSLVSQRSAYVMVAAVGRIQAINARFGYAIGDEVLNAFKSYYEKALSPNDRLFRWRGPALIALMERDKAIAHVRNEMRHFAEIKLEKTIEVGTRTVMMPISAAWSVFAVTPPVDGLIKKIEAFLAAQIPREYC